MILDLSIVAAAWFAVLAWGGRELPWVMMVLVLAAVASTGVHVVADAWRGTLRVSARSVCVPLLLLLVYVGAQSLNPQVRLGASVAGPHTVEPHATRLYLLFLVGLVALTLSVRLGFRTRPRVHGLCAAVTVLGAFEALYGLVQFLGGFHSNPVLPGAGDVVRGTFTNHCHYALLLNMTLCAGVGYGHYRAVCLFPGGTPALRSLVATPEFSRLAWMGVWLSLIGLAVVLSLSRMGVLALLAAAMSMTLASGRFGRGSAPRFLGGMVVLAVVGLALYAGIDALIGRFETMAKPDFLETDRWAIWREAGKLIARQPLWGTGLGTFRSTFPEFERWDPDVPAVYAHNDYLQGMAELGAAGMALLVWALVAAWATTVRNLRCASDPLRRGVGLGMVGVLTVVLLQEITDFSLYVPGTAALFAVLVGLNERVELSDTDVGG